jgi:hypothetical protein
MTEEGLTVTVYVSFVVFWVDILVKTCTIVNKCVFELKLNLIVFLFFEQIFILKSNSVLVKSDIRFSNDVSVDLNIIDGFSLEVQEKIFALI